ncbi:hypothetical protein GR238_33675 [Rhizobium leguminosarum]|uniref:hypothetical protein n=1 Tax=Rhizobium ruizarguesonis TaxID=2081791 RepID=UPI00103C1EAB|nr:hypothetical protein [Rhizobium ruizarguesonis]NEJ10322.1 hypothetical protein [Rhizobium ruizarguesonis]TCA64075.1 hypothetical protein E0H62_33685 [Rhizobium leguminosarum bv. viciae]
MSVKFATPSAELDYEVEAALAFHDDDAKATVATLLSDIKHLRFQLALAQSAKSYGMTRGWLPKFDREA